MLLYVSLLLCVWCGKQELHAWRGAPYIFVHGVTYVHDNNIV
jgi:hypothetical protein